MKKKKNYQGSRNNRMSGFIKGAKDIIFGPLFEPKKAQKVLTLQTCHY